MDNVYLRIANRVLKGEDGGGFVEHVAAHEWERALSTADISNREQFVDIMLFRLNYLPFVWNNLQGSEDWRIVGSLFTDNEVTRWMQGIQRFI